MTLRLQYGHKKLRTFLLVSTVSALLAACQNKPMTTTNVQQNQPFNKVPLADTQQPVAFIAFGDSGYHYDYPKQASLNNPQTRQQFLLSERAAWVKKGLPPADFVAPPMHRLSGTDYVVERTGLNAVAGAMTQYCQSNRCDFSLMLGDNIYPAGGDGSERDEQRFLDILDLPFRQLVSSHDDFRIYGVLGNHDWQTSRAGRDAQIAWASRDDNKMVLPQPGFYSFNRGDAEFFVIDTNLLLAGTTVLKDKLNPDGSEKKHNSPEHYNDWQKPQGQEKQQLDWLENALKQSSARWKIVAGHHPLWSSGGSKFEEARALRPLLMPMLCEFADLYLAGHEHDLEAHQDDCQQYNSANGKELKPLPIIVSGAAAKQRPIHTPFQAYQKKTYAEYQELWLQGMVWGFAHITLGDDIQVRMITTPNDESGATTEQVMLTFPQRSQQH